MDLSANDEKRGGKRMHRPNPEAASMRGTSLSSGFNNG